ncbi:tryptophan halogenase [Sphingomonas metalli]|uniref:Tryptophan halogenase n=1 Tax=Sphingomonas metalli TaxID=1779358 RepID=A0A916WSB5_9SPHN|nr:tryptophan 7-halogenase [Sphingomonas metalli]GGB29953.1 tryptophan halogenase [Sphingomonas metalli]
MRDGAMRSVLVAGGGLTGWCAAAALKRRAPFLDVAIVAGPAAPAGLADRIAAALPSLIGFHADLGIGEADALGRTGARQRLGTAFIGWGGEPHVHAYGRYGQPIGPTPFHVQWIRAARADAVAPFDRFSPEAVMGRRGRFAPVGAFGPTVCGLTIDPAEQCRMLRAFALHIGVRERPGAVEAVAIDARGHVAGVTVAGETLAADLYVDATGPDARLRTAIDAAWEDWSAWLPCDRVLLADRPRAAPPLLTPVTALDAGWQWTSGTQHGLAYAAAHRDEGAARDMLRRTAGAEPGSAIAIRPGIRRAPWQGNCVAIGDAATQIEPLEWCNLHLALSAIDRLVTMLPDRDMAPIEAADFNRQTLAEAERVRDFVAMHYRTARGQTGFWRQAVEQEPPASLAHSLTQWFERGRLPFYEEETFTRDGWAAILLGRGHLPRRVDPLAEALPLDQLRAMLARMADGIAAPPPPSRPAAGFAMQPGRVSA